MNGSVTEAHLQVRSNKALHRTDTAIVSGELSFIVCRQCPPVSLVVRPRGVGRAVALRNREETVVDKACPKCASARWMTGIRHESYIFVAPPPERRGLFGGGSRAGSDLSASVCADCGYTEFHAASPEKLWQEWHQHNA